MLFLLSFTPSVNARHGGRATAGLIARLAERHEIALVYLRAPEEEPVDELLLRRCALVEAVEVAPVALRRARLLLSLARGRPLEVFDSWSPELARRFRAVAEAWRPDLVQLEVERTAQYVYKPVPSASVLAAHEAAGEKARDIYRAARGAERLFRYLDLRAWRRFEPKALRSVDAVVCFTERDRRALSSAASNVDVRTIPLRIDVPERPLDPRGIEPPTILFIGGFGHEPNVDAAVRLATRIFPPIRARIAEARLYLVGDKPPPAVRRLADEHTVVTGRVLDVTPYLDRAAVVAAPLRLGGGMRVKVLEALASGKAVVASPLAAEGLATRDSDHLIVAESDDGFAESVLRLLADMEFRVALARRARAWAEKNLGWEKTIAAYEALYADLLARMPAVNRG